MKAILHLIRSLRCIETAAWLLPYLASALTMPAWGAPKPLVVKVVNQHFSPARPVEGIEVGLTYFDSGQKITASQKRTGPDGRTELLLSPDAAGRVDLHIEISDAPGLVIYQPSEGLLSAVPENLTVVLLPKGSPALLEPIQIEAMLNRLSRIQLQNQQLKLSLTRAEAQKPDFDQALREWAISNGFSYADVDQRVHAWANHVLANKAEASLTKQGEAEFGLRHFEQAAHLFEAAADKNIASLDNEEKEFMQGHRKKVRDLLLHSNQEATSFQLADQFHAATLAQRKAADRLAEEIKRYPEDPAIRYLWLLANLAEVSTRLQEGNVGVTQDSVAMLKSAIADCTTLLKQIQPDQREVLAVTINLMGHSLFQLGVRSSDREAITFFAQAASLFRNSLQFFDAQKDPKLSAQMRFSLAATLLAEAGQMRVNLINLHDDSPESSALMTESITLFEDILATHPKKEDPALWAFRQTKLANALTLQGLSTSGPIADAALQKAENAASAALAVYIQAIDIDNQALTQETLAGILDAQGTRAVAPKAVEFFTREEAVLQQALELRKQAKSTIGFLDVQSAIGKVYRQHAARVQGSSQADLLMKAASAYQTQLKVLTREGYPTKWGRAELNLAFVLAYEANAAEGTGRADLLAQAAAANTAALTAFDRSSDPSRYAQAELQLGEALFAQGQGAATGQMQLLTDAVRAFRAGLEAYPRSENPKNWAYVQSKIGIALLILAKNASPEQAPDLFTQSIKAFRAQLEVSQQNTDVLQLVGSLYHEYAIDFVQAYEFTHRAEEQDPNPSRRLDLSEASLTASHFQECLDLTATLESTNTDPAYIAPRDAIHLACRWGARQPGTSKYAEALASELEHAAKTSFTTNGDRQYLATSPEFATGRPLWIRLFQALQDNDGPAMALTARQLSQVLAH